ncbi:hypothetical protein [Thiobacter aerophilum]|uniref:Uncharacterized protein n=1 Tax=Thiobacter aerophilum TaxID=3121275 RepID=A0ABV0EEX4_9BURK
MITTGTEKTLGLKVGDAVCALIKASHVILGVDQASHLACRLRACARGRLFPFVVTKPDGV